MDIINEDQASQNSYYAKYPMLPHAWLYIVVDIRDMSMSKIGLTKKQDPMTRISQGKTYNPFLMPFTSYDLSKCTYGCSQKELEDIEAYLHSRSTFGGALKHLQTGCDSEWFYTHPDIAENQVDMFLAKRGFSVGGLNLFTYYEGYEQFGNIVPDRMKKIKTISRPMPYQFYNLAVDRGMHPEQFQEYYQYLLEFHERDDVGKVYL